MDIEQESFEQQVLAHEARQSKSLETLSVLAQVWSTLLGIGIVLWLIVLFAANR